MISLTRLVCTFKCNDVTHRSIVCLHLVTRPGGLCECIGLPTKLAAPTTEEWNWQKDVDAQSNPIIFQWKRRRRCPIETTEMQRRTANKVHFIQYKTKIRGMDLYRIKILYLVASEVQTAFHPFPPPNEIKRIPSDGSMFSFKPPSIRRSKSYFN